MEIYLDNSATTRTCNEAVLAAMEAMRNTYGNPSSLHSAGFGAERLMTYGQQVFADIFRCSRGEILFTSGGTESDNLAITGAAMANRRRGTHLITTRIEHPAVLEAFKYLEGQGFETTYLSVDKDGIISLEELSEALREDTVLVSIMHVNNEIGSVQPVHEAGALIKKKAPGCIFHVDDVQGFGKLKLNPKLMKIDMVSVSGHKIHSPKGIGVLYVNKGVKLQPIMFGGGQQGGLRPGTENVPGVAGIAAAAELAAADMTEKVRSLYEKRKSFVRMISDMEDVNINGAGSFEYYKNGGATYPEDDDDALFAPHIISLSVRGVRAEVLLHALEDKGIFVSSGSACSSKKRTPSKTLTAIGLDKELLESTIRLSMSAYTTTEELEETAGALHELIGQLRRYTRK